MAISKLDDARGSDFDTWHPKSKYITPEHADVLENGR
jgi:hypothetical protein